jgi:serine/threonine protein phosphatase PrpC
MALYRMVKLCLDGRFPARGNDAEMVRWLPTFRAARPAANAPARAMNAGLRIESAAVSHQGCVRPHNEDSHLVRDEAGLWAVADGMGGHEGGDWASRRIVDALAALDVDEDFDAACAAAERAIVAASGEILAESRRRGKQMGSTVVALVRRGARYALLWVGDSRGYRMRGGRLEQLSRDHSQVQEMVARGLMTAEQAIGHPMGHILSRAVGVQAEIAVDRVEGELNAGDIFLLCSDGLHGVVRDEEIAGQLARAAPDEALEALVEQALARGAPDNVTAVAIWASEPTLLSFADPRP